MNLKKKKKLAARTIGVGTDRIAFRNDRIEEIKEAITKQDIRDLFSSGAIIMKKEHGRLGKIRRKNRGMGNVKRKIKTRKKDYVRLTRKLRTYLKELRKQNRLNKEDYQKIRKEIRTSTFRSKSHMKELRKI